MRLFHALHAHRSALWRASAKSIGEARLMIGNAIRMMARAAKSRAGCHFAAAIGLRSMLEDLCRLSPTLPSTCTRCRARRWAMVSTADSFAVRLRALATALSLARLDHLARILVLWANPPVHFDPSAR